MGRRRGLGRRRGWEEEEGGKKERVGRRSGWKEGEERKKGRVGRRRGWEEKVGGRRNCSTKSGQVKSVEGKKEMRRGREDVRRA